MKWIGGAAVSAIVLVALACFVMLGMKPAVFDYKLDGAIYEPEGALAEERRELVEAHEVELKRLREEVAEYGERAAALDADRLWPLQRVTIVKAIQEYAIEHGALPMSVEELREYVPEELWEELALYRLTLGEGEWRLYRMDGRGEGVLVAVGE